jgi:hypothetical protein
MIQKFDASRLKGHLDPPDNVKPTGERLRSPFFHAADRVDVHLGRCGKGALAHIDKRPGSPELISGCEHSYPQCALTSIFS